MKNGIVILLFLVQLIGAPLASAELLILEADQDTTIDSISPNTNFGDRWNVLVSGMTGKSAHGLLHFDFTGFPDSSIIESAALTVFVHGNISTSAYIIHPLLHTWSETSATWNVSDTGVFWTAPGGDYEDMYESVTLSGAFPNWVVTDITALVSDEQGKLQQGVVDFGLLITADAGYTKSLSEEFSSYANAGTCHSCHGLLPPELDQGKSVNCDNCHSQGNIPLHGAPTLLLRYQLPDSDGDGIADEHDNCPDDANPDQADNDSDEMGDVCDPDDDNDTIADSIDNCPSVANARQEDTYPPQGNGCGDHCECEGNSDGDQDVDAVDAMAFRGDFGRSMMAHPCTAEFSCKGDFDCDADVDSSEAARFKMDYGRNNLLNPCPRCPTILWCPYP